MIILTLWISLQSCIVYPFKWFQEEFSTPLTIDNGRAYILNSNSRLFFDYVFMPPVRIILIKCLRDINRRGSLLPHNEDTIYTPLIIRSILVQCIYLILLSFSHFIFMHQFVMYIHNT